MGNKKHNNDDFPLQVINYSNNTHNYNNSRGKKD